MAFPDDAAIERLLDRFTRFFPAPLCPEVNVFQATSVIEAWQAAEELEGGSLVEAPFWAIPWPAGLAIARVLLDEPERARGKAVLDIGAGGGVSSLAAARAGARRVVAADRDPWALRVSAIAARRQGLALETFAGDLARELPQGEFDLVLAGDLAYERSGTPLLDARLRELERRGAALLVADAGRKYFAPRGLELVRELDAPSSKEIDDRDRRRTTVWQSSTRVLPPAETVR